MTLEFKNISNDNNSGFISAYDLEEGISDYIKRDLKVEDSEW